MNLSNVCLCVLFAFAVTQASAVVRSPQGISTLIAGTNSFQEGDDETAFRKLDTLINEAVGYETLKSRIEAELIWVLESSASVASKQRICTRLQLVGTDLSVPVLSTLLESGDDKLVEAACYALSSNPSEAARKALRKALGQASGNGLIAIIHLLGEMQDSDSTMPLIGLGTSTDPSIQAAVFNSLGELANTPATEFLTEQLQSRDARTVRLAGLALMEAAQNLETTGHPEMASNLYTSLASGPLPDFIRRGAFLGNIRANGYADVDPVISAIRGDDPVLASAAVSLIPQLKGELTTLRLVRLAMGLSGSSRLSVIEALARRGDKAALFPLMFMLEADDNASTFIQVAASLGDASIVPSLLVSLKKANAEKTQTIRETLVKIHGDGVDQLIIDELKNTEGNSAILFIDLLAQRGSYEAVPILFQLASEREGPLVEESLRALRNCGKVEDLPFLMDLLEIHENSSYLRQAREALASIGQMGSRSGIPGAEVLGALLSVQQKPVRIELLHILGMIRDPAGLEYLMDAFEDSDASIRQKSAESTLRIAQMSVSREDNNPLVEEALQSLVEKSGDPAIQKQAKTLLSKILH
jgi:HEAT repeat protein